ncbi:MAG: site-specific integrase [Candidatus Altiarchaeota archaeon]|nr:site-specific integrase [Candidatus Altiarchaeota archaeon]
MPRHREGPVRNVQTGYYFFDSYIGLGPDRQRVRFSLHTKDPGRAQLLFEQEWKRVWAEYYGLKNVRTHAPVSLAEIIPEFIANERDIKRTKEWKMYEKRLEVISDILGKVKLQNIGRVQFTKLDKFLREKRGVTNYTVNHYFGLLKTLFNYAIAQGKHPGPNPVKEVKPYVVDRKRRSFSGEEIDKILKAAKQVEKETRAASDLGFYAHRLVLLLLYSGMRLGEAMHLKWSNIKPDQIVLQRTETKQRKEKIIPITRGIRAVLDSLESKDPDAFVFPIRRLGERLHAHYVMDKIRKTSGVKDFEFHGLRHTAATIMVSEAQGRGVGLADIMRILGHSKVETTLRYLHEDGDRMRKAVEIVEEKFSGKKK